MDDEQIKLDADNLVLEIRSNPTRFAKFVSEAYGNATPYIPGSSPVIDAVMQQFGVSAPTELTSTKQENTKQEEKKPETSKSDKKKYGKYTEKDFLDRDGLLILKESFYNNIRHNKQRFLDYLQGRYNPNEIQEISNAIDEIFLGIKDGTVIPDSPSSARVAMDSHIENTKKGFDSYGTAYTFINNVFNNLTPWTNPDADKPDDVFSTDSFSKALLKELFAGRETLSDSDWQSFWGLDELNKETKTRKTFERTKLVISKLQKLRNDIENGTLFVDSDDSQKSTTLGYIDLAILALADGDVSELDRLILSNLGIDYDLYFGTKEFYNSEEKEVEDDGMTSEERTLLKLMEESNRLMRLLMGLQLLNSLLALLQWYLMGDNTETFEPLKYRANHNYWSFYNQLKDSSVVDAQIKNSLDIIKSNMQNGKNPMLGVNNSGANTKLSKGNQSISLYNKDWSWSEKLDAILQAAYKLNSKLDYPVTSDGHLVITTDKSGMAYCYNPSSHQVYKKSVKSIFGTNSTRFKEAFDYHYGNSPLATLSQGIEQAVVSLKNGGILKQQWGGTIAQSLAELNNAIQQAKLLKEQQARAKKDELKQKAEESGRSVKEYEAGQRKISSIDDMLASDWTRLAAMTLDVGALVTSFVPVYGTAVSGVLGLTSTATDLVADMMDDSVSLELVWKNLGINLGLSAAALAPGGGAMKLVKGLIRFVPLLSAWAIANNPDFWKSINKIGKEDLTVDDWKNVGMALSAITGGTLTVKARYKARKYNKLNEGVKTDKVRIKTKDGGFKEITNDEMKAIDKIGFKEGTDAAKAKFREITGSELTDDVTWNNSWFNRNINRFKSSPVKSEAIFTQPTDNAILLRAKAIKNARDIREHSFLSRFFNTDYDIYARGKTPFRGIDFAFSSDLRTLKEHNLKKAARDAKRPRSTPAPTLPLNNSQTQKQLVNFLSDLDPRAKVINLLNYITSSGNLNRRGQQLLNNIDPNWKNNLAHSVGFKEWFNNKYLTTRQGNKPVTLTKDPNNVVVGNGWVAFWKQGSKIEQAKKLSKKKFDEGGVLKFLNGGDWYKQLYGTGEGFQNLIKWNSDLDSSLAGSTIKENGHSNAGNLDLAFRKNRAYTMVSDNVGKDILSFYDTHGNKASILDFIEYYNNNAKLIRDFWKTAKTYTGEYDDNVKNHNLLFKAMFNSRSGNEVGLHNIGYQVEDANGNNIEGILGSSTWLRRMDRYETDFENDLEENQRRRVHLITLGDGTKAWVYKKADGNIDVLDTNKYSHLLTKPTIIKAPNIDATEIVGKPGSSETKQKAGELDPLKRIHETLLREYNNLAAINRAKALKNADPLMGLAMAADTMHTNKDIFKKSLASTNPVLFDTYESFHPVTGDFLGMQVMRKDIADKARAIDRMGFTNMEQRSAAFGDMLRSLVGLNYQAAQNDDAEIRRNMGINEQKREETAARWANVDDKNRTSENLTARERAALYNDYKLALHNVRQGLGNEARYRNNNELNFYLTYLQNAKVLEIQNKYADLIADLQKLMSEESLSLRISAIHTPAYLKLKALLRIIDSEMAQASSEIFLLLGNHPAYKFNYPFK